MAAMSLLGFPTGFVIVCRISRKNARWVPERQARLTSILQEAFLNKPKPKLVALPGKRK